jgi:hypothetical protein
MIRLYIIAILLFGIPSFALSENAMHRARITNQRIPKSDIEFVGVNLKGSDSIGYEFVGRIKNKSEKFTLYSVEINLFILDCVKRSGDKHCTVIGERNESIYLTIPPMQEKAFREPIYIYGDLLNPKGELIWHYDVVSTNSYKGNQERED